MVQQWLQLLPTSAGNAGLCVALVGTLIGVVLWIGGAQFSRPIVTLLTVALGALLGLHLPRWMGWSVNGAGIAVGAALVLGLTGYILHGLWVGIGLGALLSGWATLVCWMYYSKGVSWVWPSFSTNPYALDYLQVVWKSLPIQMQHLLPVVVGAAMVCSVGLAIVAPKFSLLLGWSLAGTTLLVGMGLAAMQFGQPALIGKLPQPQWIQATSVGLILAVGCSLQWILARQPKPAKKVASPKANLDD